VLVQLKNITMWKCFYLRIGSFIKVGVWSERTFAMILWAIGAGIYVQVPALI
jgi:hypothetical protein